MLNVESSHQIIQYLQGQIKYFIISNFQHATLNFSLK